MRKIYSLIIVGNKFLISQRKIKTPEKERLVALDNLKSRYSDRMTPIELQDGYDGLEIPIDSFSSILIRQKRNTWADISNLVAVEISQFLHKRSLYLREREVREYGGKRR